MRFDARRFTAVGVLVLAVTGILVVGVAAAGGPFDQILANLGIVDSKVDVLATGQADLGERLDGLSNQVNAIAASQDQIHVEVHVDEAACVGVPVQCTSHHTTDPASPANHNPVAITFFVTRNGQPLTGLTSGDVAFDEAFFPAAGPGLERCDDGDGECSDFGGDFQESNGVYTLWVHPFYNPPSEPLWHAGTYTFLLQVTDTDGAQGYGLGRIVIDQ